MSDNLPNYLHISSDLNNDLRKAVFSIHPDKIAILVDENTRKYCLEHLQSPVDLVIEISSGEKYKTLETCTYIWEMLTDAHFTRKSLLINLGGGVIGDMGGFAAATYKRGMVFINIPTTLLSQVDASIGGKLGVDFKGLKNHIGLFQNPTRVIIYPPFLSTLSVREIRSGFAEIIKHALIKSKEFWITLKNTPFEKLDWRAIVPKSISIKNEVVKADLLENGPRKILNYGHTIGHALESYFLTTKTPLLHGEAVALGMILENHIAVEKEILNKEVAKEIENHILSLFDFPSQLPSYLVLKPHLLQDKKNDEHGLRFSLLRDIGDCAHDVLVEEPILNRILK